jgi:DNA-binding transcriptional regulator YiaG
MDGDEIRRRREALGLTQAEVAAWAGVHVRTVSKWERGIHRAPAMLTVAFRLWEEQPDVFDPHAMSRARRPSAGANET